MLNIKWAVKEVLLLDNRMKESRFCVNPMDIYARIDVFIKENIDDRMETEMGKVTGKLELRLEEFPCEGESPWKVKDVNYGQDPLMVVMSVIYDAVANMNNCSISIGDINSPNESIEMRRWDGFWILPAGEKAKRGIGIPEGSEEAPPRRVLKERIFGMIVVSIQKEAIRRGLSFQKLQSRKEFLEKIKI